MLRPIASATVQGGAQQSEQHYMQAIRSLTTQLNGHAKHVLVGQQGRARAIRVRLLPDAEVSVPEKHKGYPVIIEQA